MSSPRTPADGIYVRVGRHGLEPFGAMGRLTAAGRAWHTMPGLMKTGETPGLAALAAMETLLSWARPGKSLGITIAT